MKAYTGIVIHSIRDPAARSALKTLDRWARDADAALSPNTTALAGSPTAAATDLSYVTVASETGLSAERVLTPAGGITLADGGAGTTVTLSGSNFLRHNGTVALTGDWSTGAFTITDSDQIPFNLTDGTPTIQFGDGVANPASITFDGNSGNAFDQVDFIISNAASGGTQTLSLQMSSLLHSFTASNTAVGLAFTSNAISFAATAAAGDLKFAALAGDTITLNSNATDTNTQVLSDDNTAILWCDAGADAGAGRIGINNDTPDATLQVTGGAHVTGALEIDGALNHDGTTVGFYNVAPVTRPTAYTQTYSTADKTHAAFTSADLAINPATNIAPWGFSSQANAEAIQTQLNALRVDVADVKQLVNSVIDDLQSQGLLQ